jgi:nucleoside triphosphate diphosphatase
LPNQNRQPLPDPTERRYTLDDLLAVMARLRDKDTGCPWDIEQNFATIAPYTIEEAYEVADAIAREDAALRFRRRGGRDHPQDDPAASACIRRRESRRVTCGSGSRPRRKPSVARARQSRGSTTCRSRLPALARAVKLQKRAAEVGFDWPDLAPEEIAELRFALAESEREPAKDRAKRVAEEFGDVLFVMANIARHLKVDPEAALRDANTKFVRRFKSIVAALAEEGRSPEDATRGDGRLVGRSQGCGAERLEASRSNMRHAAARIGRARLMRSRSRGEFIASPQIGAPLHV